jgi:uncharacterized membrane protein
MGLASLLCRTGGFFFMRFIAFTPRVDAWLRAIPIALIGAVLGPVAANGGPAEWAGLTAAVLLMRTTGNDFVAAVGAVGIVALVRAAGLSV